MKDKILTMLEMQDQTNINTIGPDWRDQNLNWCRAIWIECAELMDHYGWKWWKKQERDDAQVKMELVDIFHFGLSYLLSADDQDSAADILSSQAEDYTRSYNFYGSVESIAFTALAFGTFRGDFFFQACGNVGLSFDELYKMYVGKNILNKFRQDNGYKDGTYRKVWAGEEDNVVLAKILDTVHDCWDEDAIHAHILQGLELNYEITQDA